MDAHWIELARQGDRESRELIRHRLRERLRLYAALQLGPLLRLAQDPDSLTERAIDRAFELLPSHAVGERGLVFSVARIIDAHVDALACGAEFDDGDPLVDRSWIPPTGLRALEDLPEVERNAITGVFVLGLSLADVADRLGQTERTTERLVGSARRSLREHGVPIEKITSGFHVARAMLPTHRAPDDVAPVYPSI